MGRIEEVSFDDQSWINLLPLDRDSVFFESGTRSFHVRNQELSEGTFYDFHPFRSLPSTPDQNSIYLTDQMPLVAVLPSLGNGPSYAFSFSSFEISYEIEDFLITINAIRNYGTPLTLGDALAGESEYLLPLGKLPAGTYQTILNYTETGLSYTATNLPSPMETEQQATFPSFTVHSAPEPGTGFLLATKLLAFIQRRPTQVMLHTA